MQLISRLMDHVLAKNARSAPPSWVATSGDTGGGRGLTPFARPRTMSNLIVLFPPGAAFPTCSVAMMTTTGAANVHALAIEGTFDDCQGDREGDGFNHHNFREPGSSLSGVNSINWARIVGAGGLLLYLGGWRSGATLAPPSTFNGADRPISATSSPATSPKRMGPAGALAAYRGQRQRHPAAPR